MPAPAVPYDQTFNQAALNEQDAGGWYLWMLRPDGKPGELFVFTRNEVGDAILDVNLSDQAKVVAFFDRLLTGAGYTVTGDGPPSAGFLASWSLAPGRN